ncbi:ABC transporter substrate-binding protein [Bradyrhizobium pachyrhizi]|uniref:ABC transporter substrate-binding protein n=1 Tax=Bradyrhizobium pachyrhizi TaxID=280333 RepID=A0A844SPX4_9BRAD|nr:ABC transporter substrate-binding protein [Bradyrhizobium pachyrhizi]MVT66099.1 ABC transporter substrate-binding protein [Bradyrhizobium pachyrhizi]
MTLFHRRHVLKLAGAAAAGFAVPAIAQARPALKIASVETLSGPGSTVNRLWSLGLKYCIDKLNADGGWNGQKIVYAEYDTEGTTGGASQKTQAAIADGAHIIAHGGSSNIGGQITEDVRKWNLRNPTAKVLFFGLGIEALELTGAKCHFHFFRFATNADIRIRALVAGMKAENALGQKVFSINQNYSWGQDIQAAIEQSATENGFTVVDKVLHDVNKIQDFSPYVARIAASRADTVFTGNWGNDLSLLLKAVQAAGLKVKFATTFLDLPGALSSAGSAALGYFHAELWNPQAFGAFGQELWTDYKAKMGTVPSTSEAKSILCLLFLQQALKSIPEVSKIDVDEIAKALEKTSYKAPTGDVTIRPADHQIAWPIVVSKVEQGPKFPYDGTDMGFVPVKVIAGSEALNPVQASCKLQRPA